VRWERQKGCASWTTSFCTFALSNHTHADGWQVCEIPRR
jgi:hypothetical protein